MTAMVKLELSLEFRKNPKRKEELEKTLRLIPKKHLEMVDRIVVDSAGDYTTKFTEELCGNDLSSHAPIAHAEYDEGNGTIIRIDYVRVEQFELGFARTLVHEVGHVVGYFLHGDQSQEFAERYARSLVVNFSDFAKVVGGASV